MSTHFCISSPCWICHPELRPPGKLMKGVKINADLRLTVLMEKHEHKDPDNCDVCFVLDQWQHGGFRKDEEDDTFLFRWDNNANEGKGGEVEVRGKTEHLATIDDPLHISEELSASINKKLAKLDMYDPVINNPKAHTKQEFEEALEKKIVELEAMKKCNDAIASSTSDLDKADAQAKSDFDSGHEPVAMEMGQSIYDDFLDFATGATKPRDDY